MPRVLILGATGYVGKRLADSLVRSGQHRVYGIARSDAKANSLTLAEVSPIVCQDPLGQPEPLIDAIRKYNIDIVVDVAGAGKSSNQFLRIVKQIGEERLASYKTAGFLTGPKLGYIYCSGSWVHGSGSELRTDLDIPGNDATRAPVKLVSWRLEMEQAVLRSSDVLDIAILRPALIYGRESSIWTPFILPLLQAAREDASQTVRIPLQADAKPALVHVDDVATGFKCAVEKLSLINAGSTYPVFDLITSQESMSEIFDGLANAIGLEGRCELVGSGGDLFAQAMSASLAGSSDRAKQLLGWQPRRLNGFSQDIDIYANAWASQQS